MSEPMRQSQELAQETHRAMTLRERMEYELAEFERAMAQGFARIRASVRELPPDDDPGPSVPVETPQEGP